VVAAGLPALARVVVARACAVVRVDYQGGYPVAFRPVETPAEYPVCT